MNPDPEPRGLFAELKRRRVFRTAIVYVVVAWIIIEASSVILPALNLPYWTVTLVVALVLLGLPLAIGLAWAFDVTPDGVRRTLAAETSPDGSADADAVAPGHGSGRPGLLGLGRRITPAHWTVAGAGVVIITIIVFIRLPSLRSSGSEADLSSKSSPGEASTPAVDLASIRSIAVLPFVNMSTDEENEYFSDGITEELLNALAQISNLKVAARTSSFSFKGRNLPVDSIGRVLSVETVLEGSVRKAGERVRITAQLIETRTGYHLWSATYDRVLTDIFAVQDEIAQSIVGALGLGRDHGKRLVREQTNDPAAHALYLRGRHSMQSRTREGIEAAIGYFQQALGRDQGYVEAVAGLADAYQLSGMYGVLPMAEAQRLAEGFAERALAMDSTLAEAHTSMAGIYLRRGEWTEAERAFHRALELNPSYVLARRWYTFYLAIRGRWNEALAEARRAAELDPISDITGLRILIEYWTGDIEAAYETVKTFYESSPDKGAPLLLRAYLDASVGRRDEALHVILQIDDLVESLIQERAIVTYLGAIILLNVGDTMSVTTIMDALETEVGASRSPDAVWVAAIHAELGDQEAALTWLYDKTEWSINSLFYLVGDPAFESIRGDPRYRELLSTLGLSP